MLKFGLICLLNISLGESEIFDGRLPVFSAFKAILAIAKVLKSLLQLLLGVQDERTSPNHRLINGLAC